MKAIRGSVVVALVLAPALLLTSPSYAATPSGAGAPATAVSAATTADDPADDPRSDDDLRVAVFRVLGDPDSGEAVYAAASKALDENTRESLIRFLDTEYPLAQAEDDRFAIFRILADPKTSPAVWAAAQQALTDGTPEALRHFLEVGQYEANG